MAILPKRPLTTPRGVPLNILLTSAGRRSYLVDYFKEALAGQGLVHAGNCAPSVALQAADRAVLTPLIHEPDYIPFLLDYCRAHAIGAIVPLFDIDLPVLAKARKRFARESIQVVVPDWKVALICNDKWQTYQFLRKHGLPAPFTALTLADAYAALEQGRLRFPVVIKPRWGMGSLGLHYAGDAAELPVLYQKTRQAILTSYLRYESEADLEHSILIQERLGGAQFGLDVVNDLRGNYVCTLVKRKIAMRAGETDHGVTVCSPFLESLGERLANLLKHRFVLSVDCFLDRNTMGILEFNGRLSGHYPFAHLAGARLPSALVRWLAGETPEPSLFQVRYGVEGMKDLRPVLVRPVV